MQTKTDNNMKVHILTIAYLPDPESVFSEKQIEIVRVTPFAGLLAAEAELKKEYEERKDGILLGPDGEGGWPEEELLAIDEFAADGTSFCLSSTLGEITIGEIRTVAVI